ncbi:dephospho-CoA kinase [Haloferula sargassicola]|uniref:Dephospho-CoA kinase n=1 Tax=Haloferula sargassicola TaxID=490096 RepID=A0ABP9UIP0_9BACT
MFPSARLLWDDTGVKNLALTGGIASGKSFAADEMVRLCARAVRFDSDVSVRELLRGDRSVIEQIGEKFGPACIAADGQGVDRGGLRARVFGDAAARRDLERLLHPKVREECLEVQAKAAKLGAPLFLAEVPLLFEGGFDFGQDLNLVVAVSRETQLKRLSARDGFDTGLAASILAAQLPMERKVLLADVVFWNEGPRSVLTGQIERFLHTLLPHER